MDSQRYFNLFAPQALPESLEDEVIGNNVIIDYQFGNSEIIKDFVAHSPQFRSRLTSARSLSRSGLADLVSRARRRSVLMTVLMTTGRCNADCPICYTDRRAKPDELTLAEMQAIIDQTYDLGSRLLYIPGEGEPTLDPSLWGILEYVRAKGMDVILFTNGILLSNDELAHGAWAMSSREAVERLAEYPVYIYYKLWSFDRALTCEMMNISEVTYEYANCQVGGREIELQKGLAALLEVFPRHRVGIETVVEKRNLEEIVDRIIPFVQDTGVRSYIEPIIHSGRCFGRFGFDPEMSADSYSRLQPWLSRQQCRRLGYKITVLNTGHLTYGMALAPSQITDRGGIDDLNVRERSGKIRDMFNLIHTNPTLVHGRYQMNGCVCEEMNLKLAREAALSQAS